MVCLIWILTFEWKVHSIGLPALLVKFVISDWLKEKFESLTSDTGAFTTVIDHWLISMPHSPPLSWVIDLWYGILCLKGHVAGIPKHKHIILTGPTSVHLMNCDLATCLATSSMRPSSSCRCAVAIWTWWRIFIIIHEEDVLIMVTHPIDDNGVSNIPQVKLVIDDSVNKDYACWPFLKCLPCSPKWWSGVHVFWQLSGVLEVRLYLNGDYAEHRSKHIDHIMVSRT